MPTERSDAHPTEDSGIGISSKGKSRFPQFGKMRSKSKENDTEKKVNLFRSWTQLNPTNHL